MFTLASDIPRNIEKCRELEETVVTFVYRPELTVVTAAF